MRCEGRWEHTSLNSCFTGSGRMRALRPNFGPVMPRAGARVPPGPKFGKADTLCVIAVRSRDGMPVALVQEVRPEWQMAAHTLSGQRGGAKWRPSDGSSVS